MQSMSSEMQSIYEDNEPSVQHHLADQSVDEELLEVPPSIHQTINKSI